MKFLNLLYPILIVLMTFGSLLAMPVAKISKDDCRNNKSICNHTSIKMKPIALFTLLIFIVFTIDSCHSQGGGGIAANIGAYITLYKLKEKKRKEAEKNRRPQHYPQQSNYYNSRPEYYGERPNYYGGRPIGGPLICFGFFCN
ncbi:unnamed protein product [Chironomus riparius]|uniref:Uncharacterized protein n=1 Tax=Chironomus riparius TaxID=315576 RepID=A0A9N9RV31_9DIPT|nr:unnamed protein product [Chironomus riparius]